MLRLKYFNEVKMTFYIPSECNKHKAACLYMCNYSHLCVSYANISKTFRQKAVKFLYTCQLLHPLNFTKLWMRLVLFY